MFGSRLIFILTLAMVQSYSFSPLLRLLQATARVAEELVLLTQHLGCGKLPQTRSDRGVLFNVDGQIEEELISGRSLASAKFYQSDSLSRRSNIASHWSRYLQRGSAQRSFRDP